MESLFVTLGRAVEGSAGIALGASFLWGILSILTSPCHLTSIPLIVGFIDGQGRVKPGRAFLLSLLFASGILVTIGLVGLITAGMGRILGDLGAYANYAVAAIFFAIGLHLVGVYQLPFSGPGKVGYQKKGMLAALVLGLVFGIALGPCTFAFMLPVLGVTFKVAETSLIYGAIMLIAYGLGHCAVIVAAGTFTGVVQRYLNWNDRSRGAQILKITCGVLIILGGLYLLYTS
jgi:cytochrome c-type biogenesis protein